MMVTASCNDHDAPSRPRLVDGVTTCEVTQVCALASHSNFVFTAVVSPSGRYALSTDRNYRVELLELDPEHGALRELGTHWLERDGHYVYAIAWSADENHALLAYDDDLVQLVRVDPTSGSVTEVDSYAGAGGRAFAVDWARGLPLGLVASGDGTVRLLHVDTETGRVIQLAPAFDGHRAAVTTVAFAPDGRHALSGDWIGTLKLLRIDATGHLVEEVASIQAHDDVVQPVVWSPDGTLAVTGGWMDGVGLFGIDAERGTIEALDHFDGHTSGVDAATWSPDGRTVLTGGHNDVVYALAVGHTATGELRFDDVMSFTTGEAGFHALSWVPGGTSVLATGSELDALVSLLDVRCE